MKDFFNLYRHGFARMAVATPAVRVGDPQYNLDATVKLMREAAREKAVVAVFPELGLSADTCDDLSTSKHSSTAPRRRSPSC